MDDVQVAFRILTYCFMQCPSYILQCTPPFFTFTKSLISFDFSLLQMFGHLLGLGSFDSLEGFIVCKQISFLITFGGVELISTSTITPTSYLRDWTFVALIIVVKFMVEQCPFLFEALA
jgi:hypothetical protein